MAFIMCLGTTFLIAGISTIKRISIEGVMLFGVAVMFAYDSLLTMMQYIASETQLQTFFNDERLLEALYAKNWQ